MSGSPSNGECWSRSPWRRQYRAEPRRVMATVDYQRGLIESVVGTSGILGCGPPSLSAQGGELRYTMTATGPEQVEFMLRQAGPRHSPPIRPSSIPTYSPCVDSPTPCRPDFIPGVTPYAVGNDPSFSSPTRRPVRMVLTFDALHDANMDRASPCSDTRASWTNSRHSSPRRATTVTHHRAHLTASMTRRLHLVRRYPGRHRRRLHLAVTALAWRESPGAAPIIKCGGASDSGG